MLYLFAILLALIVVVEGLKSVVLARNARFLARSHSGQSLASSRGKFTTLSCTVMDDATSDGLKGKDRRAIRAIAARMAQLEVKGKEDLHGVERLEVVVAKAENLKEAAFIGNIKEILDASELVKLKVLGKDVKKKHVKEDSLALCAHIPGAVVAQCVGHTALLFKPSGKLISELLAEEVKKDED